MALKLSSLLLLAIFLATASQALSARAVPSKFSKATEDVKRPDCLIDGDGTVAIPGIGRVSIPGDGVGVGSISGIIPSYGDAGVGFDRQYVPGNDDLPVPNPGYEVPIGSSP